MLQASLYYWGVLRSSGEVLTGRPDLVPGVEFDPDVHRCNRGTSQEHDAHP